MKEPTSSIGAKRILVVEDDTLVGMGVRSQLQKLGHVVVGDASTVVDALDLFRQQRPDVVLLDIRLDGGDGIDLAAAMLKERRCPNEPVRQESSAISSSPSAPKASKRKSKWRYAASRKPSGSSAKTSN